MTHHLDDIPARQRFLYIRTFGCQMNEYDSLRVQRLLAPQGYVLTGEMDAADVIFLNTCSVRHKAEQKVYSFLGRLRRLKARNPGLKIVVGGCVAQQLGAQLLDRFDQLDLVLGTHGVSSIAPLLEEIRHDGRRRVHMPEEEERDPDEFSHVHLFGGGAVAAPVTVMTGCDNFCSYCIVPFVRGRERSRPLAEIIHEIQALAPAGVREVLLLGQNVNSYGRGLAAKASFVELLRRIQAETDIPRIRFTTSHPKDLTDELIRCFADLPSLCNHLHLPFQAGSDSVLKRMNRGYTAARYIEKIRRLRAVSPDIGLSSDVMVGFPGESEDDFRRTLDLIQAVRFDSLFSFRYSDRPFTRSADFPDKVPEEIKARRLTELQALQSGITLAGNEAEKGSVREILVEGPSRASNGQFTGRTQQNRIVNFAGGEELVGKLVAVKIVAGFSHSLQGELIGP